MLETRLVLGASIICQLAAAFMALYLIRLTRRWSGWGWIAAAMFLQAARRAMNLGLFIGEQRPHWIPRLDLWLGVFISVMILFGVVGLLPVFRALRRNEEALREANSKLLTIRENERRALASELHDSLGHHLFALQLEVERAASTAESSADRGMADLLTTASRQCGSVMNEVRRICHGLYPPTLESLGIVETLRALAAEHRPSLQVDLRIGGDLEGVRFPREVEIACFRLAQEAITNAVRHGGATAVTLMLNYDGGMIVLTVEDNGAGFEPDSAAGQGLGLTNMRQRTNALGGDIHIFSLPGRTQIVAVIPTRVRR